MGLFNKFLNIFRKKQPIISLVSSTCTSPYGPAPVYISIWDTIINSGKWECVQCGTFSPHTCDHCLTYVTFVHNHAPDKGKAITHLANIHSYNENKKDNLYSWKDYEEDT